MVMVSGSVGQESRSGSAWVQLGVSMESPPMVQSGCHLGFLSPEDFPTAQQAAAEVALA